METTTTLLVLLTSIVHADVAPVSPGDAAEELRERYIAFVEESDPFTDETTLRLQVVGVSVDAWLQKLREHTVQLASGNLPPSATVPDVPRALFAMECNADGGAIDVSTSNGGEHRIGCLQDGVRLRVDDDPMMELSGMVENDTAAALLDRLQNGEEFIVQQNPPTAGHIVYTFTLYVERREDHEGFDKRPIISEFRERCAARRQ